MKIISGGQTGADRGGLDAAIELGLEHGGWCPKGRKAEDGIIPSHYQMREADTEAYKHRTGLNIMCSDMTIIFLWRDLTPGSLFTIEQCETIGRPHLIKAVQYAREQETVPFIRSFIERHCSMSDILTKTVNIAGTRESLAPGIQEKVKKLLVQALA